VTTGGFGPSIGPFGGTFFAPNPVTATITAQATDDVQVFLESDLTGTEWTERQADELAIELAGKDRLEKALIIGEKLSHIYNSGTFRRSAPGGERWSWEQYVTNRLPELLPGEAPKVTQANCRRFLWEVRQLVSRPRTSGAASLPSTTSQAEALQGLIPRAETRSNANWNPSVLDDPEQAEGLRLVWGKALERAQQEQRKNGPTADDVRIVREQWRTQLELAGQIRQAPKSFQAATAERSERAAQRTVEATAYQPPQYTAEERKEQAERAAERQREHQRKVEQQEVRDAIERPDREAAADLQKYHKLYADALAETLKSLGELRRALSTIATVKGTIYLDELRECQGPLGFNYLANDIAELKRARDLLLEIVQVATSSEGPQSIDWATINTEAK
jgi:hypothetical protein